MSPICMLHLRMSGFLRPVPKSLPANSPIASKLQGSCWNIAKASWNCRLNITWELKGDLRNTKGKKKWKINPHSPLFLIFFLNLQTLFEITHNENKTELCSGSQVWGFFWMDKNYHRAEIIEQIYHFFTSLRKKISCQEIKRPSSTTDRSLCPEVHPNIHTKFTYIHSYTLSSVYSGGTIKSQEDGNWRPSTWYF